MSVAKSNLLAGLRAIKLAVDVDHLIDKGMDEVEHNTKARLLRNGLCVVAFTMLEDFIKSRMAEVMTAIGSGPLAFGQLPKRLQKLGTVDVLDGLRTQARRLLSEKQDALPLVQEHTGYVASTARATFQMSYMGFGRDASNLNANAIKMLLGDFQIKDGWGKIRDAASRVGLGIPSPEQSFTNASRSRHAAAHDIRSDTQIGTLRTIVQDALTVAIGYDLVVSRALQIILAGELEYGDDEFEVDQAEIRLRFVDQTKADKWSCYSEGASRAWRTSTDFAALLSQAVGMAASRGEFLVVRDLRKLPTDWYTLS